MVDSSYTVERRSRDIVQALLRTTISIRFERHQVESMMQDKMIELTSNHQIALCAAQHLHIHKMFGFGLCERTLEIAMKHLLHIHLAQAPVGVKDIGGHCDREWSREIEGGWWW